MIQYQHLHHSQIPPRTPSLWNYAGKNPGISWAPKPYIPLYVPPATGQWRDPLNVGARDPRVGIIVDSPPTPSRGRDQFLKKATEDPIVTPKKNIRVISGPALDMKLRLKITFEVIRQRILEIPEEERLPIPFDIWSKLMLRIDNNLKFEENGIDILMKEHEEKDLIVTGPIKEEGTNKRYARKVTENEVLCFSCMINHVDTLLQKMSSRDLFFLF